MWHCLPTEITTNILHRLPVKTLIKCTILSKSFLSLINCHDFIYTHIAKKNTTHLFLKYLTKNYKEKYHFELDDDHFSGFQREGFLVPFYDYIGNWFSVVGCVNGVICLVSIVLAEDNLILWNPSIKKYVQVPRPKCVFESCVKYVSTCGFGFDSISNDYKVVRLVHQEPYSEATQVEVYSLRSECWRVIGVGPRCRIKRRYEYIPCFLHGCVHWVASLCVGSKYESAILKFDMSVESFEILEVPGILKETWSKYKPISEFYVQECKGMLSLIRRNYGEGRGAPKTCSIWIMKEYGVVNSWMKVYDFEDISVVPRHIPSIYGFRNNGEVIMVKAGNDAHENVIVSIDPIIHVETILGEITGDRYSFYLSRYVESMVLFKEGKGIEHHSQKQLRLAPINCEEAMEE